MSVVCSLEDYRVEKAETTCKGKFALSSKAASSVSFHKTIEGWQAAVLEVLCDLYS
jgi:hypothetical protein